MKQEMLNELLKEKLIFIFKTQRIDDESLIEAVQAVVNGGGRFIELTYDQPAAFWEKNHPGHRYNSG